MKKMTAKMIDNQILTNGNMFLVKSEEGTLYIFCAGNAEELFWRIDSICDPYTCTLCIIKHNTDIDRGCRFYDLFLYPPKFRFVDWPDYY